jgi:hypothetical protein
MGFELCEAKSEQSEAKPPKAGVAAEFHHDQGEQQKHSTAEHTKTLEQQGVLPKVDFGDAGKTLQDTGAAISEFTQNVLKTAALTAVYGADYALGADNRAKQQGHVESNYDIAKSDNAALRDLSKKDPYMFNCHYLTKTFIEGKQPSESLEFMGRGEVVSAQYLQTKGFKPVPDGSAKPGDVILIERAPSAHTNELMKERHSAVVVPSTDGTVQTLQKLDPDSGLALLSLEQTKQRYGAMSGGDGIMTVYRKSK